MYISIWKKSNINNEIVIVNWKIKGDIMKFVDNELVLEKDQKFKLWVYNDIKSKDINTYILINIKDLKDIKNILEDFVSQIWNCIQKLNKSFFLDLDKLNIDKKYKSLIEDLLAINLYSFTKYKSKTNNKYNLVINDKYRDKNEFNTMVESICLTRDFVNEPANELNPDTYSHKIEDLFKKNNKINIDIIKWKDLQKFWMNGIYNVWKASDHDPRLIIINYRWNSSKKIDFGLIWKWVCFDAGWYNLKPTGYIEDMKIDMAGSATVIWVLNYLVKSKSNKNIIVWVPLVENMISDEWYKPWDVIKMYNWKTVEIWNTDAEWRLILADTLSYVEKKFKPKYMFDIATLTWAQMIALWSKIAAIIWNNSKLNKQIQDMSWDLYERVWELPMFQYYFKSYESNIADMANSWSWKFTPWTINWWLFLSRFIDNKNWVHFDIAGPAWISSWKDELYGTWWTWFWVRLFINLVNKLK